MTTTASEQYVIAAALTKPQEVIPKLSGRLEPAHFSTVADETIWSALLDAHEAGLSDRGHVSEILRQSGALGIIGGENALAELMDRVGSVVGVNKHADRVIEAHARRRTRKAARQLLAAVEDDTKTLDDLADLADGAVSALRKAEAEQPESVMEALAAALDAALDPTRNARNVHTGLTDLDDVLQGMRPGTLVVLGGRPSQGKSALGTTILRNLAAQRASAMLVSLEMNSIECALRLASADTSIPLELLLNPPVGVGFTPEDAKLLDKSMGALAGPASIWSPDYMPSFRQIAAQATRHKDSHGRIDLLLVDYVGLINTDHLARRYRSREQEVSWLSRNFKSLARRLDCPVLLLAQLNRDSTKGTKVRRPQLSDLRESGALEQDADQVLFVHRQGFYDYEGGADGTLSDPDEVIVAKNRNGKTGVVRLEYVGELTRWQDRPFATSYEVGR